MSSSRARSAIQESLTKKGFMEKPGGDHFRYVFVLRDGRKTGVFTKMSGVLSTNISPTTCSHKWQGSAS